MCLKVKWYNVYVFIILFDTEFHIQLLFFKGYINILWWDLPSDVCASELRYFCVYLQTNNLQNCLSFITFVGLREKTDRLWRVALMRAIETLTLMLIMHHVPTRLITQRLEAFTLMYSRPEDCFLGSKLTFICEMTAELIKNLHVSGAVDLMSNINPSTAVALSFCKNNIRQTFTVNEKRFRARQKLGGVALVLCGRLLTVRSCSGVAFRRDKIKWQG